MNLTNIKFGWIKDRPDKRDWMYPRSWFPRIIPRRVDLRDRCSDIEDQGNLGSCVGNAVASAIEFVDLLTPEQYREASRLFIYYNARAMIGMENEDSGCHIRDAVKSVASKGVCSEDLWPYDVRKFAVKPTEECYDDGLKHRTIEYRRLQTLDEIKACLAEGYPVVMGFYVYPSCMTDEVARTGHIPFPSCIERYRGGPIGGHAGKLVGFNDDTQEFTDKNSWGKEWGDKGYGYLPYKFITQKLADDFWTIRKIEE